MATETRPSTGLLSTAGAELDLEHKKGDTPAKVAGESLRFVTEEGKKHVRTMFSAFHEQPATIHLFADHARRECWRSSYRTAGTRRLCVH